MRNLWSELMKITEVNTETGNTIVRDMTAAELAATESIAATVAKALLPLTSEEKLFNATGLTVAEYKALGL